MPGSLEFFAKHKNRIFVESGTLGGDGVVQALDAGFEQVITIELCEKLHEGAKQRFAADGRVSLVLGDSGVVLGDVLSGINEPVTFWLDGHYSSGDTAKGPDTSPVLRELAHIRSHPIKTHTILIDDVRLMGGIMFDDIRLGTICERLFEINPNYKLSLETGFVEFQNDVLVASI